MKYEVELKQLNNNVLKSVVQIHNSEYGTKFTPTTYLNWILNNWFENKLEEKHHLRRKHRVPT